MASGDREVTPGLRVIHTHPFTALGESPVWDDQEQALLWVDIENNKLFRLKFTGRGDDDVSVEISKLYKKPCAIALRQQGKPGLLVAYEDGFCVVDDPFAKPLEMRYLEQETYKQVEQVRLNDGKCDRQGRFVCGGYDGHESAPEAACGVYIVDGPSVRELLPYRVRCANSITFSPAGDVMYFTDSPQREILAFEYDTSTGEVKMDTKRVFARIEGPAVPDGSCVDSEGYVWNAQYGSGKVVRYAPDGKVDRVIHAPASNLTCPALGGPDLKTLFITSAAQNAPEGDQNPGCVFAIDVSVAGLPEPRYREE